MSEIKEELRKVVAESIEELRAKLAALTVDEPDEDRWQPIETAPKDGTGIDVWARNASGHQRRICDVSWQLMTDWDGSEYEGWTGMYPVRFGEEFEPTHWQPLPSPPKDAGK